MKSEAYMNGWFSHLNDFSETANPYQEHIQRFSYVQWISGWCDRFSAVKHGHDLSLDEDLFK